jgi:hypothetical protein
VRLAYHAGAQIALARWHAAQQVAIEAVLSGVRRLDIIELRAWLAALEVDFLDFMGELDRRLESQLAVDPRPRRRRGAGGRRMSRSNPWA